MPDAIKVLGQLDVSATTITTLYTVPDLTQTTVSSLVICNRSSSGITFRVSVHVAGAGADDKQFIFYNEALAATTTRTVVIGMCLNQADVVKVYSSAADVSFNMFGVETT
ncbi:MAG: hypothetical protein CMF29_07575 [Kiritimatiellaceae bacterium]|nr:hypothetical protein [Kiritimatiellaceae bacterium]MAS98764.1 hypothetical protein [Kiritimatiellaceae bacterium]